MEITTLQSKKDLAFFIVAKKAPILLNKFFYVLATDSQQDKHYDDGDNVNFYVSISRLLSAVIITHSQEFFMRVKKNNPSPSPTYLARPETTHLVDYLLLLGVFLPQLRHLSPQSAVLSATKQTNNTRYNNCAEYTT